MLLSASRPHISGLPAPTLTAAVFRDLGKVNSGSPDCSCQFTLLLAFPSPNFHQEMWSNPHLFFLNLENEDSRCTGKLEEGFYWHFKKNQVGILAPPPISCVTFSRPNKISKNQSPHLKNGRRDDLLHRTDVRFHEAQ